jgi:DNA polymerase III subunit epsilon
VTTQKVRSAAAVGPILPPDARPAAAPASQPGPAAARPSGEPALAPSGLAAPGLAAPGLAAPGWPAERSEPAELSRSLAGIGQPLAEIDFVIVDVETTGWLPDQASITEIGAVRVTGGQVRSEFCTLVNPGAAIPADITALTGITDAMVSRAPAMDAALPRFLAFAQGGVLTAHNAAFDIGFLTAACSACGVTWPAFPVLDTVTLARLVLGAAEVPDRKLRTLADFFGAQTLPCHRALPDSMATAEVLLALLRRLAATGVRTLAELSAA